MGAFFIKIYMNIVEFLGRILVLNRNFPTGSRGYMNLRYSPNGLLDVFTPVNTTSRKPVFVYIHGGGWITGSRRTCRRICATFAMEGYIVLNLKYSLGPKHKHPKALHDVADALIWLDGNAEKYHADLNNIFFGGSSAGAHLAAMTSCIATNPRLSELTGVVYPLESSKIRGNILVYGGYNMKTILDSDFFMIRTMLRAYIGNIKCADDAIWKQISPVDHITEEFPPSFITAGERDHLFGQSVEFKKVLENKKIYIETLLFDYNEKKAKHGFFHFYNRECTQSAYKGAIDFMKKQMGEA